MEHGDVAGAQDRPRAAAQSAPTVEFRHEGRVRHDRRMAAKPSEEIEHLARIEPPVRHGALRQEPDLAHIALRQQPRAPVDQRQQRLRRAISRVCPSPSNRNIGLTPPNPPPPH